MSDAIRDNSAAQQFEFDSEGHTAVAYYRRAPGVITFTHTEVAPALRGRGVASRLMRGALEAARAEGLKVVARCEFVAAYVGTHPEYAELLL